MIKHLQMKGQITPEVLIDLYPSYDSGKIVSKDDLIIALRVQDLQYMEQDRFTLNKLRNEYEALKQQSTAKHYLRNPLVEGLGKVNLNLPKLD